MEVSGQLKDNKLNIVQFSDPSVCIFTINVNSNYIKFVIYTPSNIRKTAMFVIMNL
jgi:hypothetical protein